MTFILLSASITAFFVGSLPMSKFVTYVLTANGRIFGKRYLALIRVFTDIAKGALGVWLGHKAGLPGAQMAVMLVYLGHIFPLGAGFGQQNGTGTLLGALIVYDPVIGLTALSSWLFAYYVYRHASFSAVFSAGLTTLIFGVIHDTPPVVFQMLVLLTGIVMWRHRHHLHVRV